MTRTSPDPVYPALFCALRTDRLLDALPLTATKVPHLTGQPSPRTAAGPLPEGALAGRAPAR
ncbi:hypothetical protein DTB58_14710, partial [Streptomyces griseus]|nr:hypothetical protein [Streptomyces griseus]